MNLSVRPANTEVDAASCARIYAPFVSDNWVSFELDPPNAAEMARRINAYRESHGWLVAEVGGEVAVAVAVGLVERAVRAILLRQRRGRQTERGGQRHHAGQALQCSRHAYLQAYFTPLAASILRTTAQSFW